MGPRPSVFASAGALGGAGKGVAAELVGGDVTLGEDQFHEQCREPIGRRLQSIDPPPQSGHERRTIREEDDLEVAFERDVQLQLDVRAAGVPLLFHLLLHNLADHRQDALRYFLQGRLVHFFEVPSELEEFRGIFAAFLKFWKF